MVANGRVFVGTDGGKLLALKTTDGQTAWTYSTGCGLLENCRVNSSPAFSATGEIIFGTLNGWVHAVRDNGNTASFRWKYRTNSPIAASPAISANQLVYLTGPAGAFALDVATGALRWKKIGFASAEGSPAIDNRGVLWTAGDDGFVRAYSRP